MNGLKPTFTREELLNKNIVDIKQNPDHEFGYVITQNGLDVTFVKDSETHAFFMAMSEDERNKLLNGALSNWLFVSSRNSNKYIKCAEHFLRKYHIEYFENAVNILSSNKEIIEEIQDFIRDADANDEEDVLTFEKLVSSYMTDEDEAKAFLRTFEDVLKKQNQEIADFIASTNLVSPFDEVVIKHYLADDVSKSIDAEIYTYIKVLDRNKNLVTLERYEGGKDIGFELVAKGTYAIGHTIEDAKRAIRRSVKTTAIAPKYLNAPVSKTIDFYLPYDYLAFLYAWYKTLRERSVVVREVTSKVSKATDSERRKYVANATKNNRRVITLGQTLVVYTRDEQAVKSIKKRKPNWHVDSFERRDHDCHYHRKDGTILVYHRGKSVVRPKKDKNNDTKGVTYVVK